MHCFQAYSFVNKYKKHKKKHTSVNNKLVIITKKYKYLSALQCTLQKDR